jgi:transcriptional regulator with XRE-family HTH domain
VFRGGGTFDAPDAPGRDSAGYAPRVSPNPPHVGEALREARTQQGVTLRDLAARAGTSPGHVCGIENGKRAPSPDLLARLHGALTPTDALRDALDSMLDTSTEVWLRETPAAVKLLRVIRERGLPQSQIEALCKSLESR